MKQAQFTGHFILCFLDFLWKVFAELIRAFGSCCFFLLLLFMKMRDVNFSTSRGGFPTVCFRYKWKWNHFVFSTLNRLYSRVQVTCVKKTKQKKKITHRNNVTVFTNDSWKRDHSFTNREVSAANGRMENDCRCCSKCFFCQLVNCCWGS